VKGFFVRLGGQSHKILMNYKQSVWPAEPLVSANRYKKVGISHFFIISEISQLGSAYLRCLTIKACNLLAHRRTISPFSLGFLPHCNPSNYTASAL